MKEHILNVKCPSCHESGAKKKNPSPRQESKDAQGTKLRKTRGELGHLFDQYIGVLYIPYDISYIYRMIYNIRTV